MKQFTGYLLGCGQPSSQLCQRACIQHIGRLQPSPPGVPDGITQVVEVERAVRIAVDGDHHAGLLGHLAIDVLQIETFRMGVELQCTTAVPSGLDDALHVDLIGLALTDQTAARMRKDVHVAMLERTENARGLLFAIEFELTVHGGHDDTSSLNTSSGRSSLPFSRTSTSIPFSSVMPCNLVLSRSISVICRRRRLLSSPFATARCRECSVMARYSRPRSRAASAISASVLRPSVALVCACRSPLISCRSSNLGSWPCCAASISPRSSRSSGGMYGRPTDWSTEVSVVPAMHTSSRNTPYSLILRPRRWPRRRIAMLCALLPELFCCVALFFRCGSLCL